MALLNETDLSSHPSTSQIFLWIFTLLMNTTFKNLSSLLSRGRPPSPFSLTILSMPFTLLRTPSWKVPIISQFTSGSS